MCRTEYVSLFFFYQLATLGCSNFTYFLLAREMFFFLLALFLGFKYIQIIIYSSYIHRWPIIKSNKRKEAMITALSVFLLLIFILSDLKLAALKVDRFCINYKFLNGSAQTKAKQGEIHHNL